MTKNLFFLTLLILLLTEISNAELYRRKVNFDWEQIPNATGYEIELKPVQIQEEKQKSIIFKTTEPSWTGKLIPGKYLMRLRSLDHRKVPGEWSEESDFFVSLEKVKLLFPENNLENKTKSSKMFNTVFKWEPTAGATEYVFELESDDNSFKIKEKLEKTEFKTELPVAQKFKWRVTALNPHQIQSENPETFQFALIGSKIDTVKADKPENLYVREITWGAPNYAKNHWIILQKLNKDKKFETIFEDKKFDSQKLLFKENWPGGFYKFSIKSQAPLREDSDYSSISFQVKDGDRSETAEYLANLRKSIERSKGWYGIASWFISSTDFTSESSKLNGPNYSNALSGTGRLGLGLHYPDKEWGFIAILDLSGIIIRNENHLFAASELNAVYKKNLSERSELRYQMGLYYKEFPATYLSNKTLTSSDFTNFNISTIGPHVGLEYWYSMTPELGLQANAHFDLSLLSIKTPPPKNGGSNFKGFQFGFLGSYRLSKKMTGLLGYAYKIESINYDTPTYLNNGVSTDDNDKTTSSIKGHYLNLFAEYNF